MPMNSPIDAWLKQEALRQEHHLELIASENYAPLDIMALQGSLLTNKYAEGYPGRRYYGGCEFVDHIESYAIQKACELFECAFANVQPHSGSSANAAVYQAVLKPFEKVMGLSLSHGGHLTHGSPVNFSGYLYQAGHYTLSEDGFLDYDAIEKQVMEFQPKLLIAGYSAYPRAIDWAAFRRIADKVGAVLLADIAHISGLVAAKEHASPFPYADIVTSTTHKTLRGPRSGIILWNDAKWSKKINSAIFPGNQGGPLMHVIAAKARCFEYARLPEFVQYQKQVKANAHILAAELVKNGFNLVSGGTDNHLMLISLIGAPYSGKEAQHRLEEVGITLNRNTVPLDPRSPQETSGLRLGSAALTTRGIGPESLPLIANWIAQMLDPALTLETKEKVEAGVRALCLAHPVYGDKAV